MTPPPIAWYPFESMGMTPWLGWVLFAALWVVMYRLARICERYRQRDEGNP